MGKSERSELAPELHNSVCPKFSPDTGTVGPPGVERMGPPGAQRVEIEDFP